MKNTMFKFSRVLIVVLSISALIFTGCSCGNKKDDKDTTKNNNKGIAATIINEDGEVEYVDDIIKKNKDSENGDVKGDDEADIKDLIDSGDNSDSKKSKSKKSSSKSSSKSNAKKSDSEKTNDSKSSDNGKKSDSKKKDSGKKSSDKKSDDKEQATEKSNFNIEKSDNDKRFGPIIDGKKKK